MIGSAPSASASQANPIWGLEWWLLHWQRPSSSAWRLRLSARALSRCAPARAEAAPDAPFLRIPDGPRSPRTSPLPASDRTLRTGPSVQPPTEPRSRAQTGRSMPCCGALPHDMRPLTLLRAHAHHVTVHCSPKERSGTRGHLNLAGSGHLNLELSWWRSKLHPRTRAAKATRGSAAVAQG